MLSFDGDGGRSAEGFCDGFGDSIGSRDGVTRGGVRSGECVFTSGVESA